MNVLKMTDSELYKLGIEILTTKLGKVGISRFLTINMRAPCTGDYTNERHEWLDKSNKKTAVKKSKEVEKKHDVKQKTGNPVSPTKIGTSEDRKPLVLRVREMSDLELYEAGLEVLVDKLSIAGMPRFIRLAQRKQIFTPLNFANSQDLT
ncbi:MAG: hypothetical protein OXU36_07490 [Candidatus Poribacteria bacterium]|nr:hypothetical protein [Candidatus Poribacteria bacterium]